MTKTIAGGGEWSGVAAQIEAAIGQPIPPANSPELDDFLSTLRVNHPGYADMLEKARPVPETDPEADADDDDGLLITGKSRLRQVKQQATRRMWWRPASFGKLVLNKKRGGPLILTTLALLFGAYTISYFAKPKGKTGGLANGPVNQDTGTALDAATNPQVTKVKVNPTATGTKADASGVDAATVQGAKDGTLRQTQAAATPLGNPVNAGGNSPVNEPPPAFNTAPMSEPVAVRPQAQAQTPIFLPVPSTPTPRTSSTTGGASTGATSQSSFGSFTPSTPLPSSSANGGNRAATPILLSPIPSGSPVSASTAGDAGGTATAPGRPGQAAPADTFGGDTAPPRTAGVTYQRSGQAVGASVANVPKTAATTPGIAYVRPTTTGGAAVTAQALGQPVQNAPAEPNVPAPALVPPPPVSTPAGSFGNEDAAGGSPQTSAGAPQSAPAANAPAPGVMYVASGKKDASKETQVFYAASDKSQGQSGMLASASAGTATNQKEFNVTAPSNSAQNAHPPADMAQVGVVPARLITVLEAPLGRPVPAVAESSAGVWVGVAQPNAETGRMEVTFSRLIRGNDSFQVNALAYDTGYQLGLAGTVNDRAPAVLQDVFRAALNGLNTYAQGLAQAGTTTVAGNTVVATQSAPALGTVLAGQMGQLFQLPQGNTSVIRTLRVERETAVYIMTGVTSPTAQR